MTQVLPTTVLTAAESHLLTLLTGALHQAYPDRALSASAHPGMVGWLHVVVTETAHGQSRDVVLPVRQDQIGDDRLRHDLSDQLMGDLRIQLGQAGQVG
jgi:hypothetical protein